MKKNIDNIIFDLGGVLLNIDYTLTSKAFKRLGVKNFDALYSQAQQNNVFNDFETGKLSAKDFRTYIKEYIPKATDREIDDAWNSMLLDLPKKRLELLNNIKKKYRIFLLSNTNEIHVKYFTNYLNKMYGKGYFESLFEKHYYSNEIGLRKPNIEAFEYVCKQNDLEPSNTLFIDDSIQHIKGAKKAGLQTYFLDKEEVTSLFLDKVLLAHHL